MGEGNDDEKAVPADPLNRLKWAKSAQDVDPPLGLAEALRSLQLLAKDKDRNDAAGLKWDEDTPASMQVIKSGATAITRAGTKWVARTGGLAATISAVAAGITGFSTQVGDAIVVALIISTALILAASALACAIFVRSDLEARGRATAARHSARAEVASAFLQATAGIPRKAEMSARAALSEEVMLALAAFPGKVHVRAKGDPNPSLVTGVKTHPTYRIQLGNKSGNWTAIDEIESYTTSP